VKFNGGILSRQPCSKCNAYLTLHWHVFPSVAVLSSKRTCEVQWRQIVQTAMQQRQGLQQPSPPKLTVREILGEVLRSEVGLSVRYVRPLL